MGEREREKGRDGREGGEGERDKRRVEKRKGYSDHVS